MSVQIDGNTIQFGNIENNRLGQQMPVKITTLCKDETFHPEICLVAIEPVSNFILVERYAINREAKTWNEAVSDALSNHPVKVIQVASIDIYLDNMQLSDRDKHLMHNYYIEVGKNSIL